MVTMVALQDLRQGINGVNTMVNVLVTGLQKSGTPVRFLTPYESGLIRTVSSKVKNLYRALCKIGNRNPGTGLLLLSLWTLAVKISWARLRNTNWHAHDFLSAWLIRKLTNQPVILTCHYSRMPWTEFTAAGYTRPGSWLDRLFKNWFLELWNDHKVTTVFVSRQSLLLSTRILSGSPAHSTIIYNGISQRTSPSISVQDSSLRLVSVGRITPVKEPSFLIDALAALTRHVPSATLTFIGPADTAELERLHARIGEYGLQEKVSFTGPVPPALVSSRLGDFHMYLHAATSEAFGLTVIEAMSAGLPVVARRYPALDEILGKDHPGVVPTVYPPQEMAKRISALAMDSTLRNQLILEQKKRVEHRFLADRMVTAYEKLYQISQ